MWNLFRGHFYLASGNEKKRKSVGNIRVHIFYVSASHVSVKNPQNRHLDELSLS